MIKTEWSKINEYTYHNYDFSYRQCDYYCKAYMFAKHLADARENIVVIKSNYFTNYLMHWDPYIPGTAW